MHAMPVELTDAELDAVAAGAQGQSQGAAQAGLINAAVGVQAQVENIANNVQILSHNNTNVVAVV